MSRGIKVPIQPKKRSTITAMISNVNKKTVLRGILTLELIRAVGMVMHVAWKSVLEVKLAPDAALRTIRAAKVSLLIIMKFILINSGQHVAKSQISDQILIKHVANSQNVANNHCLPIRIFIGNNKRLN